METALLRLLTESLPTMLPAGVVAIVLGYIGRWAVPAARRLPDRWAAFRDAFVLTAPAHPVLVGMLLGLSPTLPVPSWMGDGWAGSIVWYGLAGVVSLPLYRRLMRRVEGGQ